MVSDVSVFNMLSRFVIAFLPRSKRVYFLWLFSFPNTIYWWDYPFPIVYFCLPYQMLVDWSFLLSNGSFSCSWLCSWLRPANMSSALISGLWPGFWLTEFLRTHCTSSRTSQSWLVEDGELLCHTDEGVIKEWLVRGTWWAPVYGVTQSRTRLKWLSSSSSELEACAREAA